MRTYQQKTAETQHDWFEVDPAGQRLGPLAVRIAWALSGKHKPTWTPHIDDGDFVVVLTADQIELGGDKRANNIYYPRSGFPGGLRDQTAPQVFDKHPERLIERAVYGMLPTNRTRAVQL